MPSRPRGCRANPLWIADDQWDTNRLFVCEPPLDAEAMFPEEIAFVAGENENCVVQLPGAFERGAHLSNAFVNRLQHTRTVADGLVVRARGRPKGRQVAYLSLECGLAGRCHTGVGAPYPWRAHEQRLVPFRGHELAAVGVADASVGKLLRFRVHRLVRKPEAQRLGSRSVEKIHGVFSEKVGGEALPFDALTINVQDRIKICALPSEGDPVVEPGPRGIIDSHVPLPDKRRFVTVGLQGPGNRLQAMAGRAAIGIVGDAVNMCVLACEETCPAGRT